MTDAIYEKLAVALDRLPNGFPRTPSNVEIPLLKKIFTSDEALLASYLTIDMEPASEIAKRASLPSEVTSENLISMAKRGLIWFEKTPDMLKFRLAPFVVGLYESQLDNMDEELAGLVDEYLADGGAAGIMKYDPALHRVIPVRGAIHGEWVLPYDDVKKILQEAKSFATHDCICRVQRAQLEHACDRPVHNCLVFNLTKMPPGYDAITQSEALKLLDEAEEAGLVHTVSNIASGIGYICNCCGCCCAILRGITEWGVEKSVAYANYYAVIDPDLCADCGTCQERCQIGAIETREDISFVIREKCIGCGLCVTGCPEDAARLEPKPEEEIVHPPENFPAWEKMRLQSRGLSAKQI
ncbi:MAG: 4Fe-4S binding protein [candidate division Zixibacteria bacterium]